MYLSKAVLSGLLGALTVGLGAGCGLLYSLDELQNGICKDGLCADAGVDAADAPFPLPGEPAEDGGVSLDGDGAAPGDGGVVVPGDGGACPSVPTGWTSVKQMVDADAGCASGFSRTLVDKPHSSTDACACSCDAPAPSNPCEYNDGAYHFTVGFAGSGCGLDATILTEGCYTEVNWSTSITGLSGAARPPKTVACPATTTLPSLANDATVSVCATSANETTCGQGACLVHDGEESECPAGFGTPRVLTDVLDISDTRACASACKCETKAKSCVNATFTPYTDKACSQGGRTAIFDGTCRAFDSSNFVPKSARYRASPDVPGCAPVSPTTPITGEVTSKKKVTLCCAGP